MNVRAIWEQVKAKDYPTLLAIVLRLEVGIPFGILDWPVSLFVALVFVFVNLAVERAYMSCIELRSHIYVSSVGSIINGIAFVVGNMIEYPPVYPKGEIVFFVNYVRIKANILYLIAIISVMLFFRIMSILLERYVFKRLDNLRDRRKRAEGCSANK